MKEANRYYLYGVFLAFLCFGIFSSNGIFGNVFAGLAVSRLPRELRLGTEIGIVKYEKCFNGSLNHKIRRGDFGQQLVQVVNLLGVNQIETLKDLKKSGIFNSYPTQQTITRKTAIEAISRACLKLHDLHLVDLESGKPDNYRDYKVPEKYYAAMSYLQKRYVVRGYPNGSLGARKSLSGKEAVYFLFRFYEASSAELMVKNNSFSGIKFVDISLSHPIMNSIKDLTSAGAFDRVMLRPCFDGNSYISIKEATDLVEGILIRQHAKSDPIRLKTLFGDRKPFHGLERRELAMLIEYLLTISGSDKYDSSASSSYIDVSVGSSEAEALAVLAKHGITMGYPNGKFVGDENVTWFETVGIIHEALKSLNLTSPVAPKSRLAQRSDIQSLTEILRLKKERIRRILSKKPKYRR